MTLPPYWKPAAAFLVLLAAMWYVDGCYEDRYQQQVGAATEAHERAERALEVVESLSVSFSRRDAQREDSIAALEAVADEAREWAAQAEERERAAREDLLDASLALDEAVTDTTVQRLIREERAAHEAEKQALRERIGELEVQLSVAERTVGIQADRIEARDELVESLRVALEERTAEAERWRDAAEPGFFEGFFDAGSQVLTTAAVVGIALLAL